MPRKRAAQIVCPICRKRVKRESPEFPFCSDRCRTVDLGKWASGKYVITSPVTDAEEPIGDSDPEGEDRER